uniref:Reverse transcriptase domain-containing protein n=1 Tax=Tanacetum cinerariifolium TaxID=118510 RepID=A0A6L2MS30_TANCI|nr:reverse transcriptase domain-containing protein [Tanacetum cinerariifolium]
MSTRSNSSHLFSPLRDPESLIRQRNLGEPSSLFDFEEVVNNNHNQESPPHNGPPPMVRPNGQAPRTMEELCQPSINGRGGPIALIPIQATDFGLRHHMIQQVQNTVSNDALRLSIFPYSLTHHAIAWYDRLPRNSSNCFDDMMRKFLSKYFPPSMVNKLRNEITKFEQKLHESLFEEWERYKLSIDRCPNHNMLLVTQIDTFYNGLTLSHRDTINAAVGGTFMQKTPEECYELIENMTAHHNHWDTSAIRDETSRNISSTSTNESPEVVRQLEMINTNFSEMMRQFQMVKAVDTKCETCGGPHSFTKCPAVGGYTQETAYATTGTGLLPSNIVPNPQEDLKVITTWSGVTLVGPSVSPLPLSKEVNRETETITDQPKPSIPYPSRVNKPKLREKDDNLSLKFVEIFRNLHFELSFADALLHMPKFALMFKSLLNNKEKLFDLATTPVNENCSAVILKKLLEKLEDPGKFLIPCDFLEFDECLALTDMRENPRVPLILGRPFLRTGRALIDVYGEESTPRVDDEAITFKVGQTLKYSYNDVESINRVDVIDVDCEEYVQEVLGFSNNSKSSNPTLISDPIIALSSPFLTPFEGGDFILEETEACLTSESIPPGIDDTDLYLEGDIRLLEKLLNNDPSLSALHPKELSVKEIKTVKYSIDEPPELELKDLPSHL